MKVAGFTFIRNAIKYGYPAKEAILSIIDICDKVFVAVGESEDNTLDLISNINPEKIVILQTKWNENLKEGGAVLADETNKAFRSIPDNYDWCVYIQGDELMHENDHEAIRKAMQSSLNKEEVQGLLFDYKHFYGSYDYVATSSDWYRKEIRIVKNDKSIYSYRDAQGFRYSGNQKLKVKKVNASIYHYGWVRPPEVMYDKIVNFKKLYSNTSETSNNNGAFDYSHVNRLEKFIGAHPKAIQELIQNKNWKFEKDLTYSNLGVVEKFRLFIERITGTLPWEYQNYKLLK